MRDYMQIVKAALCISTPPEEKVDCTRCLYRQTEVMQTPTGEYSFDACDCDKICVDAAWAILGLLEKQGEQAAELRRLTEENEALLEVAAEMGCETCAHTDAENLYQACTGSCVSCGYGECPCNGCRNFSKWKFGGLKRPE